MELLRALADGGRTIITVTHSIQSLDRCDRILFLAPGGQTAYFGPPKDDAPVLQPAAVRRCVPGPGKGGAGIREGDVRELPAEPALCAHAAEHPDAEAPGLRPGRGRRDPGGQPELGHQLSTLFRRFASVVTADRRNSIMLFMQAPILGLLMLAVLGSNDLSSSDPQASHKAGSVLVALILEATYLGASNSIREIVKERPILTRERAIGLSPSAYILSKALLLGALTIAQAAVLVFLGVVRQGGPGNGRRSSGQLELFLVVAMSGLAAMALGLVISAFVTNANKALTILPVVLFAEFLFTGSAFPGAGHTRLGAGELPGFGQVGLFGGGLDRRLGHPAAHRLQRHSV